MFIMDFTPMLLCLIAFIINVEAFRPSTNGHQIVPQQKIYYEKGPVIVKTRRFSPSKKLWNTFSYKKAYGSGSKNIEKINILSYNDKNGVISFGPKSELGNGIRHKFSYARTRKSMQLPSNIPDQTIVIPKQTIALPETIALPQQAAALPQHRIALPKQTIALPQQTVALPQQTVALPQQTIAGAKTANTAPLSEMKVLKAAFTDSTSPVHQHLVSSIEKMIVDALGVGNTDKKLNTKINTKVVIGDKVSKKEKPAIEKATASTKGKLTVKSTTDDKSVTALSNARKLDATSINGKETSVVATNNTVSKAKDNKSGNSKEHTSPKEPTEPVSAEAPTTPEPAEAVNNVPYPREQFCFCLAWCPPGTIYKGHCGRRWAYGPSRSICCLPTFIDEDDSDYD